MKTTMKFLKGAFMASALFAASVGSAFATSPVTCTAVTPGSQTAYSIGYTTATLDWVPVGGESVWDIELRTSSSGFTGIPTAWSVGLPYTINTLLPGTTYTYYVRASCGGGDYSTWEGPYSFTTVVAPPAPVNDNIAGASLLLFGNNQDMTTTSITPVPLICNTIARNNVTATMEAEETLPGSPYSVGGGNHHTTWYSFTAPCIGASSQKLTLSTANRGTDHNTFIAVYQYSPWTMIAANNDYTGGVLGCTPPPITFPTASTVDLTGLLIPGSTYLVQVGGYSTSNVGTAVVSLTSEPAAPTLAPNISNPYGKIDMSVANSGATLYNWVYRPHGYAGYLSANTVGNTFTANASAGTNYEVQAAHRCGTTFFRTSVGTYTTPSYAGCSAPVMDPSPLAATTTSVTVSWGSVPGATSFRVYAQRVGYPGYRTYTAPAGSTSFVCSGLVANSEYEFWVSAQCSPTYFPSSSHYHFWTLAPARMANPENTVSRGVDKVTFTDGDITYHDVKVSELDAYGFQLPANFDGYIDFSEGKPMYYNQEGGKLVDPNNSNVSSGDGIMSFDLVPNPTEDRTQVILYTTQASDAFATLTNLNGEIIDQQTIKNADNGTRVEFSTASVPAGLYLINVKMADKSVTRKLVVLH